MAKTATFYRLTRTDKKLKWVESKGEIVNVKGYKLFYIKKVDIDGKIANCLIEPETGLAVGIGNTKPSCIRHFEERLMKHGTDVFHRMIEDSIKKYGRSPSSENK